MTTPPTRRADLRSILTRQPASAVVLAVATFVLYGLLAVNQWRQFISPSWDLAIFTQALQRYSRLEAPIVTVLGADFNILGDHFHPLLAILAPFYAIAPSGLTVLLIQAGLLAVSVFFVAQAADRHLGPSAGWWIGIGYGLSWGVQAAAAAQFHEVALAAVVITVALWLLMRKQWVASASVAGLLVFVKEDLGLTVFMFGVVLAWRSRCWILGAALSVWGVLMTALSIRVFLPAMNPSAEYRHGGNADLSAVLGDPLGAVAGIVSNETKMTTVWMVLACSAFLVLRSRISLLVLPTLGWRFISQLEGHWGTTWHYNLILMPVIFFAVIDATGALRRSPSEILRKVARHAAAAVAVFALTWSMTLPLWELRRPEAWQTGPRQVAARAVIDRIPPGSTVASDSTLLAYLVPDHDVYFIGQDQNPVVDCLVIDQVSGGWGQPIDPLTYGPQLYPGTQWRVVLQQEGFILAERVR